MANYLTGKLMTTPTKKRSAQLGLGIGIGLAVTQIGRQEG